MGIVKGEAADGWIKVEFQEPMQQSAVSELGGWQETPKFSYTFGARYSAQIVDLHLHIRRNATKAKKYGRVLVAFNSSIGRIEIKHDELRHLDHELSLGDIVTFTLAQGVDQNGHLRFDARNQPILCGTWIQVG